mmetsp:Transcript_1937/g.4774  ORF Transcript_1937/g.4774 Transcript_1937/m.4774 type:complete len:222 (+) Transcript_1937:736-1401(+)
MHCEVATLPRRNGDIDVRGTIRCMRLPSDGPFSDEGPRLLHRHSALIGPEFLRRLFVQSDFGVPLLDAADHPLSHAAVSNNDRDVPSLEYFMKVSEIFLTFEYSRSSPLQVQAYVGVLFVADDERFPIPPEHAQHRHRRVEAVWEVLLGYFFMMLITIVIDLMVMILDCSVGSERGVLRHHAIPLKQLRKHADGRTGIPRFAVLPPPEHQVIFLQDFAFCG